MQTRAMGSVVALVGAVIAAGAASAALPGLWAFDAKAGWMLWSLAVALVVLGLCARADALRFGVVAASLVAGTAGILSLTQPLFFPAISAGFIKGLGGIGAIAFVVQAVVALWALKDSLRDLWASALRFGALRGVVVLGLLTVFSVSLMGYLPYGNWGGLIKQFVFAGAIVGVNLLSLLALAQSEPPALMTKWPTVRMLAVVAVLASLLLAWLAIEYVPHVEDEVAYLFQAKLFGSGRLWAEAPPAAIAPGLDYYLLTVENGRWYPVTTPGWPAVLVLGAWIGLPWLLNPVLAGLCVVLAYDTIRRLADRETALVAVMLVASSAWFIGSAATLMPHIASTFFGLLGWWLLVRSEGRWVYALLAGAAMGVVFNIRQLEAVLIGGLTGFVLLALALRTRQLGAVIAYGVGCVAVGGLYLVYNAVMTGHALTGPMVGYLAELWHEGANAFGFGPDIGPKERWGALDYAAGHSLSEGIVGALHNIFYSNFEFLGWSIGSLALVLVQLFWGRKTALDGLAYLLIGLTIALHLGYWFTGSFYIGPRYWSGLLVPLAYLSARGFVALCERLGVEMTRALPVLWVLIISGLLVFVPWRGAEKYHGYGSYTGDLARAASAGAFGTAAVIYDGPGDPGAALFLNDPDLPEDKPIFLDGRAAFDAQSTGRDIIHWSNED